MEKAHHSRIRRPLLAQAVALSLCAWLPSTQVVFAANITTTWNDTNGDWFDAPRWSSGIPINGVDTYLPLINAGTITLNAPATTSGISLAAPALLILGSGNTYNNLVSVAGNSSISGGMLLQTSSFFDVTDNLALTNATISGAGTYRQLARTLTLAGVSSISNFVLNEATMQGAGTLTITNRVDFSGNATIATGSTLQLGNSTSIFSGGTLTNNGLITSASLPAVQGTIAGSLINNGTFSTTGSITISAQVFNAGTLAGALSITGVGTSTGLLSGDTPLGGSTLTLANTFNLSPGALISSINGRVSSTKQLKISGDVYADHFDFGGITGAGTLHLSGPNAWAKGSADTTTVHNSSNGTLTLSVQQGFTLYKSTLINDGVLIRSTTDTSGFLDLDIGGRLDNRGIFFVPFGGIRSISGSAILNSGLINAANTLKAPFYNTGTFSTDTTTVTLAGGGSGSGMFIASTPATQVLFSNQLNTSLFVLDNATLSGPGFFAGGASLLHTNVVGNSRFSSVSGIGSLNISGTLTIPATPPPGFTAGFNVSNGAIVTLLPSGALSMQATDNLFVGGGAREGTFINQATLSQFSGTMTLDNSGLSNQTMSKFENQGFLTISNLTLKVATYNALFVNTGVINVEGNLTFPTGSFSLRFNNNGTFVASGPVAVNILGGGTSSGTFSTIGGATINFSPSGSPPFNLIHNTLDHATLLGGGYSGTVSLSGVSTAESVNFTSIQGGGTLTLSQSLNVIGPLSPLLTSVGITNATVELLPGSVNTLGTSLVSYKVNAGKLINRGTLNLVKPIALIGGGVLDNKGTIANEIPYNTQIDILSDFTLLGNLHGFFYNSGQLAVSLQSNSPGAFQTAIQFFNSGTVTLTQDNAVGTSGKFTISGGGSASGLFQASAYGGISFTAPYTLNNATLQGNVFLNSTMTLLGNVQATGAGIFSALQGSGSLTGGGISWSGGTISNAGGINIDTNVDHSFFYGPGDSDTLFANFGILGDSSSGKVLQGTQLTIFPGRTAAWARTQTASSDQDQLTIAAGAQIINNGSFYSYIPAPTIANGDNHTSNAFINTGIFGRSSLTPASTINVTRVEVPFHNAGLVDIQQGKIDFAGGYIDDNPLTTNTADFHFAPGTGLYFSGGNYDFGDSPFDLGPGGLFGTGTVHGNFLSGGTLSPGNSPGALTINGDLALQPGATLDLDIWFNASGNAFDLLTIHGNFTAGGTLALHILGTPDGSPLNLIVADNFSGAFANISNGARLTDASNTGSYLVTYGPGGLSLSDFQPSIASVPEPLTFALISPAMLALLMRRPAQRPRRTPRS